VSVEVNYEQIITKAIELAIGSGWDAFGGANHDLKSVEGVRYSQRAVGDGPFVWRLTFRDHTRFDYSLEQIIFNRDFARALWGEQEYSFWVEDSSIDNDHNLVQDVIAEGRIEMPAYKYHLQQMVIAEDPLMYLTANMPQS
jgi:hypothetical protein